MQRDDVARGAAEARAQFDDIGTTDVGSREQSRRQLEAAGPQHPLPETRQQPVPGKVGVGPLGER